MRKEKFEVGSFYHIYNRGVDKRLIFLTDGDRIRFTHSLYLLNNFRDIPNRLNVYTLTPRDLLIPIQPFVEIVAACLMPNHYHLMLAPKRENGVSLFLHKIGTSYTKYFNRKYNRTGRLFERTYQARFVDRQEYALYLTQYIHLNPVKSYHPYQAKLGTGGEETLRKTEEYPWSTLPDYLGSESKLSLLASLSFRDEILDMDAAAYRQFLHEFYRGQHPSPYQA